LGGDSKRVALLVPQRHHRIDARGAPRRQVAGEHRHTTIINATASAIVSGSVGARPNSSVAMNRIAAKAPARPMTAPTPTMEFGIAETNSKFRIPNS